MSYANDMAAHTLVPAEDYLRMSYRPDCDYVDGVVLERNAGERLHSKLQMALSAYLSNRSEQLEIHVFPEQRLRVSATRFRVPDICVVAGPEPAEEVFCHPEILSKDDRMAEMQERIDNYLHFGVRYVWIIDPRRRRAYVHTGDGSHEAKDGVLRTDGPEIVVDLGGIFSRL